MSEELWKTKLMAWLNELTRWKGASLPRRVFHIEHSVEHVTVRFCTEAHTYEITAHGARTPSYLGCVASARRTRPGEDWLRGNDLHDGPFSRETWDKIVVDILAYELVELVPVAPVHGAAVDDIAEVERI